MALFGNAHTVNPGKAQEDYARLEYHSVPYRSITHFAVETAGHFDLDAELKIWLSGTHEPIEKTFTKGVDIYEVQAILTQFVAG